MGQARTNGWGKENFGARAKGIEWIRRSRSDDLGEFDVPEGFENEPERSLDSWVKFEEMLKRVK